jgi:MYXO-CTERM domain-containing protein
MRKTLAVVALTASLTGGTAVLATSAVAGPPAAQQETSTSNESDKTGLWGLLGLLGLAGLVKKKEHTETHTTHGTQH